MKKLLLVLAGSFLCFSTAYSAPVDIPSSLKNVDDDARAAEERPISLGFSGSGEFLDKRELEIGGSSVGADMEGQFYTGKAFLTVDLLGRWDWYGLAGVGRELELNNANVGGSSLDLAFDDDAFVWGGGVNYLLMTAPEYYGLGVFVDAKYRQTQDLDFQSVRVNDASAAFTKNDDPELKEWQVALGAAGKVNYLVPFAGVTYSDTRVKSDVTSGGTRYVIEDTENKDKWGGFAGVSIVPNDYVSFDVQARFVDEQAVSGQVNVKF